MPFCDVVKNFDGDVSEDIHYINMPYAERLKKEVIEISQNPRYFGCIYRFENLMFFIEHGKLLVTYYDGDEQIPAFTEEEEREAERIIKELGIVREILLPAKVLYQDNILEKLIDYYTFIDDSVKANREFTASGFVAWKAVKRAKSDFSGDYEKEPGIEVAAIKKLMAELSKEDSIFYNRELVFLSIVLGGIPCVTVCHDQEGNWHYESIYERGLSGVDSDDSFPQNIDYYYNMEYVEEACKQWLHILLDIDGYILYR
jgi:hypothetical protein